MSARRGGAGYVLERLLGRGHPDATVPVLAQAPGTVPAQAPGTVPLGTPSHLGAEMDARLQALRDRALAREATQDIPAAVQLATLGEMGGWLLSATGRAALKGDFRRLAEIDMDARQMLPEADYALFKSALHLKHNAPLADNVAQVANLVLMNPHAFHIDDVPASLAAGDRPMNAPPPNNPQATGPGRPIRPQPRVSLPF